MFSLRALTTWFLTGVVAVSLPAATPAPPSVETARQSFARGDLLTSLAQLEAVKKQAPSAEAFLLEAEISLRESYLLVALSDLDEAEKLAPADPRLKALREKAAHVSGAEVPQEKPLPELLHPTLAALDRNDPARADFELARLFLLARCLIPEKTLAEVYAWRADELAKQGKTAAALADYRRSIPETQNPFDRLSLATLLLKSPLTPGAPEAAEGAGLLNDLTPEFSFYADMLRVRGQLRVLHYTTSRSADELALARVDLSLARRLQSDPIPTAISVELERAVQALDVDVRRRFYEKFRTTFQTQTLALAAEAEYGSAQAEALDLLLREVLLYNPACLPAWEAREKLCPDENRKSALHLIVQQFSAPMPDLANNTSDAGVIHEFVARRTLREQPYDVKGYRQLLNARIEQFGYNKKTWASDADIRVVLDAAAAVALLAPRSKPAQEARETRDAWFASVGLIKPVN